MQAGGRQRRFFSIFSIFEGSWPFKIDFKRRQNFGQNDVTVTKSK